MSDSGTEPTSTKEELPVPVFPKVLNTNGEGEKLISLVLMLVPPA
jgi:hypothetical protein